MEKYWLHCHNLAVTILGKSLLNHVSVKTGARCVVLMGASGSGKTTLLRCLLGLLAPSSGQASLLGHSYADYQKDRSLYFRMGVLFQNAALIPDMTVMDNLLFPFKIQDRLDVHAHRSAQEILERMELSGTQDQLPDALSGGMKQRAGFARALVTNPDCLVLDEPMSAQDLKRSSLIEEAIKSFLAQEGKTVLMISHDPEVAKRLADEIWVMHQGQVVSCMSPDQVRHATDPRIQQVMRGGS